MKTTTGTALTVLFFLSGAASLVYQIVWTRMLVPVFGASVVAVATVVGAFMAGLALGSWLGGRSADRRANPLRSYALLELSIGVFAALLPWILAWLEPASALVYRGLGEDPVLVGLFRFTVVFGLLLIPTTAMGATLPVLGRAVVRGQGRAGRAVSWLYAANTFGAAFGCLVVALVLLERLGVRGTILVTAAVNAFVAAGALALSYGGASRVPSPSTEKEDAASSRQQEGVPPRAARLVVWGLALSGCAALGYEVLWTRALSIVLRLTTTQALSAILVVFLTGLACGGAAGARSTDRWRRPALAFAAVQALLGLAVLVSVPALGATPWLIEKLGPPQAWAGHVWRVYAVGFAVMLLPTFLMGLAFPIACRVQLTRSRGAVGSGIGSAYAASTAGAIAGPFVAAFVLLPAVGAQRSIQLLAWTHLALAAAIVVAHAPWRPKVAVVAWVVAGISGVLCTWLTPADALVRAFRPRQGQLVYHAEDPAGTVTVGEFPDGSRLLRVNGAGEVPTDLDSIRTFRLLGNLPMLMHADPQRVLVVAFGGGITLDAVDRHGPRALSCVEIAPAVVGAAPYFEAFNGGVWRKLGGGGIRLIHGDGRNHLLRTAERYDAIVGDATHPASADSWLLYTREFYELVRSRLAAGGVFAQWLPIHGLAPEEFRTLLRTFRAVFPHATLWITPDYTVLLATPESLAPDLGRLASGLARDGVRAGLAEVGLADPVSLLGTLALDERAFAAYAGRGPLNTDDRPLVSFGDRARDVATLHGIPVMMDLLPHLMSTFEPEVRGADAVLDQALDRRLAARYYTLRGLLAASLGQREEAERSFTRAREIEGSGLTFQH